MYEKNCQGNSVIDKAKYTATKDSNVYSMYLKYKLFNNFTDFKFYIWTGM